MPRTGARPSGRRADAYRNDERVLAAAQEVFVELGPDAPVSVIAERAGVGMGTLYRRYPGKEDLLRAACVASMARTTGFAREALDEPDAWAGFVGFVRRGLAAGVTSLSHLAGTYTVTQDIVDTAERARAAIQAVVDRAHADGPLRPGVTAADVCDVLRYLRGPYAGGAARAAELTERYLALVLAGLCGSDPLPGMAADWQEDARRWTSPPPARADR